MCALLSKLTTYFFKVGSLRTTLELFSGSNLCDRTALSMLSIAIHHQRISHQRSSINRCLDIGHPKARMITSRGIGGWIIMGLDGHGYISININRLTIT